MKIDSSEQATEKSLTQLQLQNDFLSELSDVTVDMLNRSHLDELLSNILDRLIRLSSGCFAYIAIAHDSGEYAVPTNISYGSAEVIGIPKIYPNVGIGGTAWAENCVIHSTNYQKFENRMDSCTGFVQACAIPLPNVEGSGGVLCVFYDNAEVDTASQLDVLQKFAVIANAALQNARLHEKRRLELSMMEAMLDINRAIYEYSGSYDIIESVCQKIVSGFRANWARVYRYNTGQFEGLSALIFTSDGAEGEASPDKELLEESAISWSAINLKSAHIKIGVDDERESSRVHAYRKANNIGCAYFVPVISNGEAWGVLTVNKKVGEPDFNSSEKQLIDLLTNQLSIAINRQRLMQEIEFQANHDQLTGCFSRTGFQRVLKQRLEHACTNNQRLTLLYIDLDGFKAVNDTMGHDTGDQVLNTLVNKIGEILDHDNVCVARLGGDEFVVIAPPDFTQQQVQILGASIATCLSSRQDDHDSTVNVKASVGFASYPEDANTADKLLSCADIAMYHAKEAGSGQVRQYDPKYDQKYQRNLKLKTRIKKALSNNEFELHYQPKVSSTDGQVIGAEALIRWNEPEFAFVSPAEWIPIAEKTGDIHKVGEWVTRESLRFLNELKSQGINLKLSINVSATQFDSLDFPQNALDLLKDSGIDGSSIEFEITETAIITDTAIAVAKLNKIKANGISIAIDDFGVKYSSLAYLGDLPVDVLKIDRIFVQRMDESAGHSMIKPILVLAQSLGLETVVEGIETEEQLQKVKAMGCDCIQGYYYSRPVPGDELPFVISRINRASKSIVDRAA